jgi:hypothetical protein
VISVIEIMDTIERPEQLTAFAIEMSDGLLTTLEKSIIEGRVYCMGDGFYSEFNIDGLVHTSGGLAPRRYVDDVNDYMRKLVEDEHGSFSVLMTDKILRTIRADMSYPGDVTHFVAKKLREDEYGSFFIPLTDEALGVVRDEYGLEEVLSIPLPGNSLVIYGKHGKQRYH